MTRPRGGPSIALLVAGAVMLISLGGLCTGYQIVGARSDSEPYLDDLFTTLALLIGAVPVAGGAVLLVLAWRESRRRKRRPGREDGG